MNPNVSLLWFRRDLRLADNPALHAAVQQGAVVPVYIWAPEEDGAWAPGGATKWWLHHSLAALDASLRALGSRLILRSGPSLETLRGLAEETGATALYWNRLYEPAAIARDTLIKESLKNDGLTVETFNASLLVEPPRFFNKQGTPFKVFTPFYKAALELPTMDEPLPEPASLAAPKAWPNSTPLAKLVLLPTIAWDGGFYDTWTPGESGAHELLHRFAEQAVVQYSDARNLPATPGTSRLSPALHFGEVSPRQIVWTVEQAGRGVESYVREVYWREFAHYLLFHYPHTTDRPLRPEFEAFPWEDNAPALRKWQRGETGYPLVDAGMRELWRTGWMHNRVRMVVASFLVKDLRLPWQAGARWFWDTLVDADLANNTLGWQWTAGCGADAAPYFRVFNPVLQGLKFDPAAEYIASNVPELAGLPANLRHEPWKAAPVERAATGCTYPEPMVDHAEARDRALEAYALIKQGGN
jgi:deoxyribodipyrimidine photo-lyase